MSVVWPLTVPEAFAAALPFEHLLRKRAPVEALARWRTEAAAYAHSAGPRVALLLSPQGERAALLDSVASWALQTWPTCALVVPGANDTVRAAVRRLVPDAQFPDGPVNGGVLTALGADWVIPAVAGDLLHPSLAGIVARAAAGMPACVVWDWLSAQREGRALRVVDRQRAPWRDVVAELDRPSRLRAFAVPGHAWSGDPVRDAWHVRMALPAAATAAHHPEPLSIHLDASLQTPAPLDAQAAIAWAYWNTPFYRDGKGWQPMLPGTGVSVLILYRDRVELTLAAIHSVVRQQLDGDLQLVLVDNQSSPAARQAISAGIAQLPAWVQVTKIEYDAPFNHSRQSNLAARAARHDVLVFLNNDVEFLDPDGLLRLSRFARLPGVATAGVRVVDPQGATQGGGFRMRRLPGAEFNSPVEEASGENGSFTRLTVGNTFACAAVSKAAFEALGGLDELGFPVGYNDVEFCLRATLAGWKHVNVAEVRVTHAVGASRARTDEIAQKLALRVAHPWLAVSALTEWDREAVQSAPAALPDPYGT